jgi:hypothetical protein
MGEDFRLETVFSRWVKIVTLLTSRFPLDDSFAHLRVFEVSIRNVLVGRTVLINSSIQFEVSIIFFFPASGFLASFMLLS